MIKETAPLGNRTSTKQGYPTRQDSKQIHLTYRNKQTKKKHRAKCGDKEKTSTKDKEYLGKKLNEIEANK